MGFISSKDPKEGTRALAERISSALAEDKRVLWLICGGSNIPIAVEAMKQIRAAKAPLENFTIAQTDERYGPVGHPDSNWKQMQDDGFDFSSVRTIPILMGAPLGKTVADYEQAIAPALEGQDLIVGQFGMGEDGHIAGIQPHTPAVSETRLVSGYQGTPFIRVTLTFPALKKIHVAYAFVYGASKRAPAERLKDEDIPLDEEPAQILKQLPEAYFYSDQI